MQDFTADIKQSKQQSVKRKKAAIELLDEIFKEFIRSQENVAIICTKNNCSFISYNKSTEFLSNAAEMCNSNRQCITFTTPIDKKALSEYFMEFSIKYSNDFICFVVDSTYYCFMKKF